MPRFEQPKRQDLGILSADLAQFYPIQRLRPTETHQNAAIVLVE
jgi:hypothetical protein